MNKKKKIIVGSAILLLLGTGTGLGVYFGTRNSNDSKESIAYEYNGKLYTTMEKAKAAWLIDNPSKTGTGDKTGIDWSDSDHISIWNEAMKNVEDYRKKTFLVTPVKENVPKMIIGENKKGSSEASSFDNNLPWGDAMEGAKRVFQSIFDGNFDSKGIKFANDNYVKFANEAGITATEEQKQKIFDSIDNNDEVYKTIKILTSFNLISSSLGKQAPFRDIFSQTYKNTQIATLFYGDLNKKPFAGTGDKTGNTYTAEDITALKVIFGLAIGTLPSKEATTTSLLGLNQKDKTNTINDAPAMKEYKYEEGSLVITDGMNIPKKTENPVTIYL